MISSIITLLYCVAGRAHGASTKDEVTGKPTGWPEHGRNAAKILMAAGAAYGCYVLYGHLLIAILGGVLSAAAVSLGHGRFYDVTQPPKGNECAKIEEWFGRIYLGNKDTALFSKYCMAVKGLLIGLPLWPYGLLLAVLWPLSYWISFKCTEDSPVAEWVSWGCFGLTILYVVR